MELFPEWDSILRSQGLDYPDTYLLHSDQKKELRIIPRMRLNSKQNLGLPPEWSLIISKILKLSPERSLIPQSLDRTPEYFSIKDNKIQSWVVESSTEWGLILRSWGLDCPDTCPSNSWQELLQEWSDDKKIR